MKTGYGSWIVSDIQIPDLLKRHRSFYFCCVVMLLAACKGRELDPLAFEPPIFPDTLHRTVTCLHNDFLFDNNSLIHDLGTHILTRTFRANLTNHYMHIFDKETGAYVKSFGSDGRGPGEFHMNPRIRINEDGTKLYAFQWFGLQDYWSYDVATILDDKPVRPVREDRIVLYLDEGKRFPGGTNNFLAWQDKRLFVRNHLHRFEIQDTSGNTLYLCNQYPIIPLKQGSDSTVISSSYVYATLALKPDMTKFVITIPTGCIVEIFDIEASGSIEKTIEKRFFLPILGQDSPSQIPSSVEGESIQGIYELFATDEFIYAKYSGKLYYGNDKYLTNTIAVFDWLGNPIRLYVLDWNIYHFFVDSQRNRCYLIGIDADDEIPLGYFDL